MIENSPEVLEALGMDDSMDSAPLYACYYPDNPWYFNSYHMESDSSNVSGIVSQLICTAGRICEHFASDIVYDIEALKEAIDCGWDYSRCLVFYGSGVYSLPVHYYMDMPLIEDRNCAGNGIQTFLLQKIENRTTLDRFDFNPLTRVKSREDLEFRYNLWERDCESAKKRQEEEELKDRLYFEYLKEAKSNG